VRFNGKIPGRNRGWAVAHAREHSGFYRERLPSSDGGVELRTLPTLDKATLMEGGTKSSATRASAAIPC
jgi:hypothetical protein